MTPAVNLLVILACVSTAEAIRSEPGTANPSYLSTVPARESERSLEKYNKNRFKRFLFKL